MKNGKLCSRMDRFKCPFHGKIVARNEQGEIENESDRLEFEKNNPKSGEIAPWEDAELIADINANTGQNIQVVSKDKKGRNAKKRKSSNLTDISKEDDIPMVRLEKKLLESKSRVGYIMDEIERRQYYEKFHHQFNYSLQN